jgi:hypothetical protein
VLLGCPHAFFERDAMAIKESPERAAAAWNPSLSHRCNNLVQRSIRLLGNQGKDGARHSLPKQNGYRRAVSAHTPRDHASVAAI